MKIFLFLLCFFISDLLFGQDFIINCDSEKVPYSNGNISNFSAVARLHYKEYKNIDIIPKAVQQSSQKYLQKRLGQTFMKRISFNGCFVISKNDKTIVKPKAEIRYALQYSFNIQDGMKYYFTLAFDNLGHLLSSNQVPNISDNPKSGNVQGLCNVKNIAEKKSTLVGSISNASLQYSDSVNYFIWQIDITEDNKSKKTTPKIERIILNANTGEFIKAEYLNVVSSCDGNVPPYPVLK